MDNLFGENKLTTVEISNHHHHYSFKQKLINFISIIHRGCSNILIIKIFHSINCRKNLFINSSSFAKLHVRLIASNRVHTREDINASRIYMKIHTSTHTHTHTHTYIFKRDVSSFLRCEAICDRYRPRQRFIFFDLACSKQRDSIEPITFSKRFVASLRENTKPFSFSRG